MKEEGTKNKQILVAMSGGVDSSVAALLLKNQGFDVIGITLDFFDDNLNQKKQCSSRLVSAAGEICQQLEIPHYVFSAKDEFKKAVIDNFVEEYRLGRTPSPCIRCNQLVKFAFLMKKAEELGISHIATGHYARISPKFKAQNSKLKKRSLEKKSQELLYELRQGKDREKDQSYFLYRLTQPQLSKIIFPLGELTKNQVREIAKSNGLVAAEKRESQEVCFIERGKISDFLKSRLKVKEGDIVDSLGNMVGRHEGVFFYTIGQRKRIGGGYKEPMYVTKGNLQKNEIIIGNRKDLKQKNIYFNQVSWVSGKKPKAESLKVKIRSVMEPVEVKKIETQPYQVFLKEPILAVTPGQSIVFYQKDVCLGGGIIT